MNDKKKCFLAKFDICDGEHEHRELGLFRANALDEACVLAEKEQFDTTNYTGNEYFSYGDGLTACKFRGCSEITEEDAGVLTKLGIVHFVN